MTTALIDGDLIAYRCAAVNEKADAGLAAWQTDQLIARILEEVNADDWKIYLSGDNNYRYTIFPDYKANRRDMPKPRHLEHVREYLVLEHNATIADGCEADDELGIEGTRIGADGAIICSLDKDLLQVPCTHYNFVRRELRRVSPAEGLRNFYEQVLIGDATDNVHGCRGIGKAKAPKVLAECSDEHSYVQATWRAYETAGQTEAEFVRTCKLLFVQRRRDEQWSPPLDHLLQP
jgi:Autographiviridae exonuclease